MAEDVRTEIRTAVPGDEAEIANVHLNSWREAYRGLLPQGFLDQLPLTFRRRMNAWQRMVAEPAEYFVNVAADNTCIVGFGCFSAGREPEFEGLGEVQAIYLLAKYHGSGLGRGLLREGLLELKKRGFKEAFCWVLEKNPTIAFYEKSGATFSGKTKEDEFGGQRVKELAYVWNLEELK